VALDKTFYITTPIYYPSDRLHIGHTYTTVAADAIARYKRLVGYDTFYLTGTDEHGQKIQEAAAEKGVRPQEFVNEIVAWIKELWQDLHISYDKFIRTTDPDHEKVVQRLFQQLYDQGDIYPGKYEGWYCTPCETFWTESKLDEGKCPDCGRSVNWVEEDAYFLRLSRYADTLHGHIEQHPEFIQPESRRNEMLRFIEFGLEDLAVSRRRDALGWGVPVPFDDDHVIYVWFDAVTNYISALEYGEGALFERYWPADVHLVGKEIVRFHTIIWPIILLAAGIELPKRIFGHGWLTLAGEKISKSRGNVVNPRALVRTYGIDPIRYFLLREIPFGSDGSYTERALIERTNVDLANDLGNLLHRTLSMLDRYTDGVVPTPERSEDDGILARLAGEVIDNYKAKIDELLLSDALSELWRLINRANKYIDETAPWDLAKHEAKKARLGTVLYNVLETLRLVAVALTPFLVETPERIWRQLGIDDDIRAVDQQELRWGLLEPNTQTAKGDPIFPRIDLEAFDKAQEEAALEEATRQPTDELASKEEEQPVSDVISFDEFQRIDMRVAEIIRAENIKGSSKLLKLDVNLGDEERQVVAGIAKQYDPADLVGKKAVVVVNLEPARIFGVESQGMILAAVDGDDLALVNPGDIAAGSPIQ